MYICYTKRRRGVFPGQIKSKKMSALNLTEKEIEFLKAFAASDFYEDGLDSIVWDYSVNDELTYKGKTRSGVVSSLSQKGIINVSTKQDTGDRFGTYNLTDFAKSQREILNILGE